MMKTYDVTDALPQLNIPTLIFAAKYDRLTKPVASDYMHQHLPNAAIVLLSPAGHQGLIERHHETNEAAENFIGQLT